MAGGTSKKHDVVGTAVHWLLIGVRIDLFRFEGCERISSTSNDVCIQVHQNLQRGFQFLLAGEERRKISLVIMREYKLLKCMAIHDQSQKFSRDVLGKGYFPSQMSHQIPDYVIKDCSQKFVLELHAGRKNTFLRQMGKGNQNGFICV